jgi:16S rRNA (adenine1518-N6/adenine1519-N6)-dimethyltransferase
VIDQHFLINPEKINRILEVAEIGLNDSLLELGAGMGSVARYFPACKRISLLEWDRSLATSLQQAFPQAEVIRADAVQRLPSLSFDILISHLPFYLTDQVIRILMNKRFRCALMAIKVDHNINTYRRRFIIDDIVVLNERDFMPTQAYPSRVVRIVPRKHGAR